MSAYAVPPGALPAVDLNAGIVQHKVSGVWKDVPQGSLATHPPHYQFEETFAPTIALDPAWDWFKVHPCTDSDSAIIEALEALVQVGVPLDIQPLNCAAGAGTHALFPKTGADGLLTKGSFHIVNVVSGTGQPGYDGMKKAMLQIRPNWSEGQVEDYIEENIGGMAVDRILRTVHPNFPQQAPRQDYNWKLYLNNTSSHFDFVPLLPASPGFDHEFVRPSVSVQEIVIHELMHVLGAGHLIDRETYDSIASKVELLNYRPSTLMLPALPAGSPGGMGATAAADTLTDPTTHEGRPFLPAMDVDFLFTYYPTLSISSSPQIVSWRPRLDAGDLHQVPLSDPPISPRPMALSGCPIGTTPSGFDEPSLEGHLSSPDLDDIGEMLPLVDAWPEGSAAASDFELVALPVGQLVAYTTGGWAEWDPSYPMALQRESFELPGGSNLGVPFVYLDELEPPCLGCIRTAYPLTLRHPDAPDDGVPVDVWLEKPHACHMVSFCSLLAVPPPGCDESLMVVDPDSQPCCVPQVEEVE